MARILIAVWPFPGHYYPLIAVGHALRERGNEVAFYTSGSLQPILEGEGFLCLPFHHVDAARVAAVTQTRASFASAQRPFATRDLMRLWLVDSLEGQLKDLGAILGSWRPDAILAETFMWGALLVLHEARHIPTAAFSISAACMLPGADMPPFGLGLPRPRSWHARAFTRAVRAARGVLARGRRRAVDAVRQRNGLAPLPTSPVEYAGRLPLYLVPSIPEFDYQRRDLPPSVHYVGPCIWPGPARASSPAAMGWPCDDRLVVLVSEGTLNPRRPLVLRAAAQGLAGLPLNVILATGGRHSGTLGLAPLAPNIQVVEWVSFSELLPQTAVLVTTGGSGQVMAALHAGVPLVTVPLEWDQPENGRRVVAAGAGVMLRPRACTPAGLRAAVEQVATEPRYRAQAQRLREIIGRYDGPRRAAELVDQMIAQGSALQPA